MKVFWEISRLIVLHIVPEKIWLKIEGLKNPGKTIIKSTIFLITFAIEVLLIYLILALPLKALGLGPITFG